MPIFPLLADPRNYQPCTWDLVREHHGRAYWLGLFRTHFVTLLDEANKVFASRGENGHDVQRLLDEARTGFERYLDGVTERPDRFGRLDIITICYERERVLRAAGIDDPYILAKRRENDAAMKHLPALLAELDAADEASRATRLIEGVFAGNIFDLGATSTNDLFRDKSVDFHAVRSKLSPRPWLIDDLDRWTKRWYDATPHKAAVLFVDNAGCDVTLGMIPLGRAMLARGTRVILTANPSPSLNDITHAELVELIGRIAAFDPVIRDALRDGRLRLVHSGNDVPLIDLTRVSQELCDAVREWNADLVVLEGMGRGVESNLDVPFLCDAMKIAMIKDKGVAEHMGGKVYDLVLRFETAK